MKNKVIVIALAAAFSSSAFAFGLPSIPGVSSSSSSAPAGNAGQLVQDATAAITQFYDAEVKIAQALGVYNEFAANNEHVAKLKTGDAAAGKVDLETKTVLASELGGVIDKKIAEGAPLDAKQKKLAAQGTLEYVKALLSTKKLVGSIQDVAKNPASVPMDQIGSITTLAKNLPGVVTNGVSSTGTIIKYMAANGVDTSKAKNIAASMDK